MQYFEKYSLEHHAELSQCILAHTRLVAGLYLLFQIVLHTHSELVELIPLLGEPDSRVLRVPVVEDESLLQGRAQVLYALELAPLGTHLPRLALGGFQLALQGPSSFHHGSSVGDSKVYQYVYRISTYGEGYRGVIDTDPMIICYKVIGESILVIGRIFPDLKYDISTSL